MPFRFQRLSTLYPTFERQFLAAQRDWPSLSYQRLFERLLAEHFAESDYHARHLRRLGHETETQFVSCEPLQKKWASERGVEYDRNGWLIAIALAQVRAFQPDVLWIDDLYLMDAPFRARLREACGPRTLLVGWRAAPTDDFAEFRDFDLMLTSIRGLEQQFRQAGVPVELIHHGFESGILSAVPPAKVRDIPFSFAGGIGSLHPHRARLVESLMGVTPLQVWGADPPRRPHEHLALLAARCGIPCGRRARQWQLRVKYPGRTHASVFGRDYYGVLGRSRLVLNAHISCSSQDASNMRLFEATGMGACLVTDWKPNLRDLFQPDVEVVTYRSPEECAEKVGYLLQHDSERAAIAAAGQQRTLTDHTFARRIESVESILVRRLAERRQRQAA
jgi:hypothetical protein